MKCDYGCGKEATVVFKNGKRCCVKRCHCCPAQIEKTKKTQHTPDPTTGLTPLQRRQATLMNTVDTETGMSLLQLRTLKMRKSLVTVNPATGLTPRQVAEEKLRQIDPVTGKTGKQMAASKAVKTLLQTDYETGLTGMQLKTNKIQNTRKLFSPEKKAEINQKRREALDQKDPSTGLTKRQIQGTKISQLKRAIDPKTGLSRAQLTAQKNKTNPLWLQNNTRGRASKQSMKIFGPLVERLQHLNLQIYVGSGANREWFLHDTINQVVRFYDFCIPSLKLIVEFHGEKYHPNPQLLTEEEWSKWETPYTKKSADECRKIDILKESIAIENGYEYHVIWSSCNITDAIHRLYHMIIIKLSTVTGHDASQV